MRHPDTVGTLCCVDVARDVPDIFGDRRIGAVQRAEHHIRRPRIQIALSWRTTDSAGADRGEVGRGLDALPRDHLLIRRDGLVEAQLLGREVRARASTSSDTSTGTAAMILGFGRPASAAAFAMVGSMNSAMVRGPAR